MSAMPNGIHDHIVNGLPNGTHDELVNGVHDEVDDDATESMNDHASMEGEGRTDDEPIDEYVCTNLSHSTHSGHAQDACPGGRCQ